MAWEGKNEFIFSTYVMFNIIPHPQQNGRLLIKCYSMRIFLCTYFT